MKEIGEWQTGRCIKGQREDSLVWEKRYKVVPRVQARDDEGLNSSRYGKDQKEGNGDNLEGWNGEGDGRQVQEGWDMGVPMADSCWCMKENHKIL